ncbi:helix-turn-helix transcriptional regulator [Sulfitobacter mediterraneus]|uniref:helix-turn-helix domain-containing protein n=1 Tax=Sulfitobacter mediterraneus TaxID=83219 RepID=UPI001934771C|nr:helix-turn-helix transcriptional regulator [Sulfitobacter mediterraneus]MBM1311889.1 helix-turn-helix transcriptional regulator [Sulfitobacter mediterraneus]MBM1315770.1 helix-turn-helix transcriptional regulator [Sulfitobacter mediterraneus]MBM1324132.1 helix-turn-helix transcriptional regulator [Sulfitobacter mediterraneus]MBM1328044.1 helix-turn-helix transcriptional regulator [Sulfitobacter mediterraneus]MBM1399392.1 helix-turn-helix transcriptional regulator [Sulfitobacter mediterraneu
MDIRVVFARNLKYYRQACGLTQAALAAAMDVDRAHVSAMEREEQNVTIVTLQKVANALGVEPAQLLAKSE